MPKKDYTKVIESCNGDEAKVDSVLHEAFVEKAPDIGKDSVEQDETLRM